MDKKTLLRTLKALLIVFDSALIFGAVVFSYYFRFYTNIIPRMHDIPSFDIYLKTAPVVVAVCLLAFNYAGLYLDRRSMSKYDEMAKVLFGITGAVVILTALTFFFREISYSRIVILYFFVLATIAIQVWRLIFRKIYKAMRRNEMLTLRMLAVGATEISSLLIERVNRDASIGHRVIGCLDNRVKKGKKLNEVPVLGKIKDLRKIIEKEKVDEVFIGIPDFDRGELAVMMLENENVKFTVASDILGIITKTIEFDEMFGIPVFAFKELPLNQPHNRFFKRFFDILFSLFTLIILSPVLIVVAIIVKLTSPGPVFYAQERVSRDGKVFKMLKFRTMKQDAEKHTGPVWAKKDDERRTPIGTFLRKTSIDELPQFINVLFGQLSVVGPRPERPHFVEKFSKNVPRYMERHKVKGGITGWAAVNGLRGDTSLEERIKYDLYYIENWSLWFDLKIVVRTALELFHHKSAY